MLGFYCIVDIVVLLLVHSFHVPGTLPEIRLFVVIPPVSIPLPRSYVI